MKDGMSVSLYDSVNSAIMYNMEIMIKMSITVTTYFRFIYRL